MRQVGVDFTKESARAIRRLAFFLSPFAALYIILAAHSIVPGSALLSPGFAIIFSVFWAAVAAYYFFFPSETKGQKYARVVMYHMLGVTTLLFVTGFANPLAALYVLLLVATHTYLGKRGLAISAATLLAVSFIDGYIHTLVGQDVWMANAITFLSIALLGVALIGFMSTQETRRRTLLHSKKQAQLQRERLTTIINNLSDATLSVNAAGTISLYNAACLSLLDMNINLKGRKIQDIVNLVDEDGKKLPMTELLKETTRAVTRDDLSHKYADGETVRLEITYAPIKGSYSATKRQEERGGYIVIMRDITKQKSLEEERDEFISVVSHELRTPITIAEGTVSNLTVLMEKGLDTVDQKALNATIATAHEQILYLARMVNDLSTLSRAERGVMEDIEEIDVKELLTKLYHRYQEQAQQAGLQLNIDLGANLGRVETSKLYLEELLQNFITNAIKYTNKGSVTIIATRSADTVEFAVKDTGIGMSRTDQAAAFKKFYRSEDYRIRETSGTGLGLYVSAKLASMIGATIQLKSRVNFGSTFSFTLPVKK